MVYAKALLLRQLSSPVPGKGRHNEDENAQRDENGIEPDTPRGIVEDKSDEWGYGYRKTSAQGDTLDAAEASLSGEQSSYQSISREEQEEGNPQNNTQGSAGKN